MRILHVMKAMDIGGAEVVVRTLGRELTALGHEVAVASMPGPLLPTFGIPWFEISQSGGNPALALRSGLAVRRVVSDYQPDIVHAHNPGILATTAIATLRGRTVPAIATLHGSPLADYRYLPWVVRASGLPVYACGPGVAHLMAEAGRPVDGTILNGVDVTVTRTRAQVRAALSLDEDTFVVAQVGRLVDQKRPERAIQAVAEVPQITLLLVGEGEHHEALLRMAAELGVSDRVRLLGARRDAHEIMAASDAVMLTGDFEGLPLTLLEAMRLGRPVIGTDAPGIRELIRHEHTGLLTAKDPSDIARALGRLAADPRLCDRLGRTAREEAEGYTATRMARDYIQVYEERLG